jgi:hypothetical protein
MRAASWWLAGALALAACVVTGLTPHSHLVYSTNATRIPFTVPLTVGETADGRTFTVRPVEIRATREVVDDSDAVTGTFVIVDLVVDSTGADPSTRIGLAELEIGGRTLTPTDRVGGMIEDEQLPAGLPIQGSLVFELPADGLHGRAQLRLAADVDVRFDTEFLLDIDLDALQLRGSATVEPPRWTS